MSSFPSEEFTPGFTAVYLNGKIVTNGERYCVAASEERGTVVYAKYNGPLDEMARETLQGTVNIIRWEYAEGPPPKLWVDVQKKQAIELLQGDRPTLVERRHFSAPAEGDARYIGCAVIVLTDGVSIDMLRRLLNAEAEE